MSYVALATDHFDEVVLFYGTLLGFPVVEQWDRPNGRGMRFDLDGMRLEILDNARQREPLTIPSPGDRVHLVIEVDDIEAARSRLAIAAPVPQDTSWGAKLFQVRDPDGIPVTFLEWVNETDPLLPESVLPEIQGRVTTGLGRAKNFTNIPWVRDQFVERLQIDPYPGTLNLILEGDAAKNAWTQVKHAPAVKIVNPNRNPGGCDARCYPIAIDGVSRAAIVLPAVEDYPHDQVEIIADSSLRDALGVSDGDLLTLRSCPSASEVGAASDREGNGE